STLTLLGLLFMVVSNSVVCSRSSDGECRRRGRQGRDCTDGLPGVAEVATGEGRSGPPGTTRRWLPGNPAASRTLSAGRHSPEKAEAFARTAGNAQWGVPGEPGSGKVKREEGETSRRKEAARTGRALRRGHHRGKESTAQPGRTAEGR